MPAWRTDGTEKQDGEFPVLLYLCLFSGDHVKTDAIGDHSHHIEGRSHIVPVIQVIGQPHDLGAENTDFQLCLASGIHAPGKQSSSQNGQPADPSCAEGADGQDKLEQNKEDLQKCGVPEFHKYQISKNRDNIADKTADAAQYQISHAHKQTLNTLGDENMILFLQKTNQHHDQTTDHGNSIADEK